MKRNIEFDKYHEKWVVYMKNFMYKNDITQDEMARRVGVGRTHLNGLLNKHPSKKITQNHIMAGLREGVYVVDDLVNGKYSSEAERVFWAACRGIQRRDVMTALSQFSDAGQLDELVEILKQHAKNLPKK